MKKVSNLKNDIFDRVVLILEEARSNVVRAVNSNMVTAYWLIGREIVEEMQGGEERAEYGKKLCLSFLKNSQKNMERDSLLQTLKISGSFIFHSQTGCQKKATCWVANPV